MLRRVVSLGAAIALVIAIGAWLFAYSGLIGGPSPAPTPSAQRTQRPGQTPPPSSKLPPEPTGLPFTPTPVPTPIDTNIHATAVVVPIRSADLAMGISGVVNTVYVHANDQVIGGELLLQLDQTKYRSDIQVASASVDQAQATRDDAALAVEQLPIEATPDQIAAAQSALHVADSNLELAHTQLSAAQAALRQTELRAPIAGTIASLDVTTGEQVTAGETIASIGDMSAWLLQTTDISELDVVRIHPGDSATINFTALPGVTATGLVQSITGRGSNNGSEVTFTVTIQPDEFLPALRWNMSATVSIEPSS